MKIHVLKDEQKLREIDFSEELATGAGSAAFSIGRSSDCFIHLDDRQISREQAKLVFEDGKWSINQLSQSSQMVINGVPSQNHIINGGDLIQIGQFSIRIDDLATTVSAADSVDVSNETSIKKEESSIDSVKEEPLTNNNEMPENLHEEPVVDGLELGEEGENSDTDIAKQDGDDEQEDAQEFSVEDETVEDSAEEEVFGDEDPFADMNDSSDGFPDDQNEDQDYSSEATEGMASAGEATAIFSGESTQTEFPEEQDGTEEFESGFSEDSEGFGDENFSDEGFGDDGEGALESYNDSEDKTQVAQNFANFTLEIFGEFAPYDRYNIKENEVIIGRDPERCHIVLPDPEVSGMHAKLTKTNIACFIEDLQSGNGTLLNGERVNKSPLASNDEFVIGSTSFTFKVVSSFLEEEENRLMPVEEDQEIEIEEVIEVDEDSEDDELLEGDEFGTTEGAAVEDKSLKGLFTKEALKDPQKRKKLIYILLGLVVVWVLLDDGEAPKKKVVKKDAKKDSKLLLEQQKDEIKKKDTGKPLTEEEKRIVEQGFILGKDEASKGLWREAIQTFDSQVFAYVKDYKQSRSIYLEAKKALADLERIEREKQEKERKALLLAEVKNLVKQAQEAFDKKNVDAAETLVNKALAKRPNDVEAELLKVTIDGYKKKIRDEEIKAAEIKAERLRKEKLLEPGKKFYLQKNWFSATIELSKFLSLKDMDDDLVKEGTRMLEESRNNLSKIVKPLLGKARSLKEGQDLKGAYEHYSEILETEPTNKEALDEREKIKETLRIRSRKIYREAIIAESLSLFDAAKEKFQEVQQVSPSDSDYYKKATEKLKEYYE